MAGSDKVARAIPAGVLSLAPGRMMVVALAAVPAPAVRALTFAAFACPLAALPGRGRGAPAVYRRPIAVARLPAGCRAAARLPLPAGCRAASRLPLPAGCRAA